MKWNSSCTILHTCLSAVASQLQGLLLKASAATFGASSPIYQDPHGTFPKPTFSSDHCEAVSALPPAPPRRSREMLQAGKHQSPHSAALQQQPEPHGTTTHQQKIFSNPILTQLTQLLVCSQQP